MITWINLCKQFGSWSGLTKCQAWSWSKLLDALMVFLEEVFQKLPSMQWYNEYQRVRLQAKKLFPNFHQVQALNKPPYMTYLYLYKKDKLHMYKNITYLHCKICEKASQFHYKFLLNPLHFHYKFHPNVLYFHYKFHPNVLYFHYLFHINATRKYRIWKKKRNHQMANIFLLTRHLYELCNKLDYAVIKTIPVSTVFDVING